MPDSVRRHHFIYALLFGIPLLCAVAVGLSRMLFPFDSGHFESGIWAPALLAASGHNPFARSLTNHPPYIMAPYGPAYYLVIGGELRCFGLQFWCGRALSLTSAFIVVGCLMRLLWVWTGDKKTVALGGALFCAAFPTQYWMGFQRPDFLALALSWLGLNLIFVPPRGFQRETSQKTLTPSYAGVLLAVALEVAAVECRPTSCLPLLTSAAWLLLSRRTGLTTLFCGATAMLLGGITWWLNATSQGGYWWQQFVLAGSISKSFAQTGNQIGFMALAPTTWLLLGLLVLALRYPAKRLSLSQNGASSRQPAWLDSFLKLYLVAAALLAAVTASRRGSNLNYWLEACSLVAMVAALGWFRWANQAGLERALLHRRWLQCGALLGITSLLTTYIVSQNEISRWKSLSYFEAVAATVARVVPPGQPCFSDYPDMLVRANRPYYFNDQYQYEHGQPEQRQVFDRVIASRHLAALIWLRPSASPGYRRIEVPVSRELSVSLDIREDLLGDKKETRAAE